MTTTRTNTIGETISAHDEHEDCPRPAPVTTSDAERAAPPSSLPDWSECAMRVANSDFLAKRVAEGGYGPEHDSKLATELHRFIYEYDDADAYRSAWFLHRLEKLINEVKSQPTLPIDFKQATELLAMFGGEPGEVTLLTGEGHSGRGLYAHHSEYPEEGAEFLGVADDEAAPEVSKQATDQGGWQPIATAPKDGTTILIFHPASRRAVQEACWTRPYESAPGQWSSAFGPNGRLLIALPEAPKAWMPMPAAPTLQGVADGDAAIPSGERDQ